MFSVFIVIKKGPYEQDLKAGTSWGLSLLICKVPNIPIPSPAAKIEYNGACRGAKAAPGPSFLSWYPPGSVTGRWMIFATGVFFPAPELLFLCQACKNLASVIFMSYSWLKSSSIPPEASKFCFILFLCMYVSVLQQMARIAMEGQMHVFGASSLLNSLPLSYSHLLKCYWLQKAI